MQPVVRVFGSVLVQSRIDNFYLFNTETTDNRHMASALLEFIEDAKQRFIIWNKRDFIEGYLAQRCRI